MDEKKRDQGPEDEYPTSPEDAALNRLIRLALAAEHDPGTRPSDEALLAYVERRATHAQRKEVMRAFLESRSFRLELKDLIEDVEELERVPAEGAEFEGAPAWQLVDPEWAGADDAVEEAEHADAPPWEEFYAGYLKRVAARKEAEEETHGRREAPRVKLPSVAGQVLDAVRRVFRTPLVPHQFAPLVVRGQDAEPTGRPDRTPEEAAVRSFMDRIRWIDGAFRVSDAGQEPRPWATVPHDRDHLLVVRDRDHEILMTVVFDPPPGAADPRLWTLLLPSLELFSMALSPADIAPGQIRDRRLLRVLWPDGEAQRACFALTWAADGGYRALAPLAEEVR